MVAAMYVPVVASGWPQLTAGMNTPGAILVGGSWSGSSPANATATDTVVVAITVTTTEASILPNSPPAQQTITRCDLTSFKLRVTRVNAELTGPGRPLRAAPSASAAVRKI